MNIHIVTGNQSTIKQICLQRLRKLGSINLTETKSVTQNGVIKRLKDANILIISPSAITCIDNNFFNSIPELKHIALLSVGYEWIDMIAAKNHGISISTCVGANAEAVAEYTWAMILNLARKLGQIDRNVRQSSQSLYDLQGIELLGKTIGILGTGNIGVKVARIAKAFGMLVLGFNKSKSPTRCFDQIVNLETLLRKSDVISVHLPLTPETEGLIGRKEISLMKHGAIVINTAREKIVNKQAVIEGIHQGKIYGYGLDADISSPAPSKNPYLRYENILITTHNGFNTKEAKERMMEVAIGNIEAFILGKPTNLVTL